jgi:hypothetical protein
VLDGQIVLTANAGNKVSVQMFDTATGEPLVQVDVPALGFPLGVAVDPTDQLAIVPIPGANVLAIVDLEAGTQRTIDWQDMPGPTYVALQQ